MKYLLYFLLVFVAACGGTGFPPDTTDYAGPGSAWKTSFSPDGTFFMSETQSGQEISGTWKELASGYKELTVSKGNGPGAPSNGDKAYALDIPGVVLLVRPFSGTQILTMVQSGKCPEKDFTANWIVTKVGNINSSDVYGTFSFDSETSSAILPIRNLLDDTEQGQNSLGSLSCVNGTASIDAGTMYLTETGGAIVQVDSGTPNDSSDDNFIVALASEQLGSISALNGDYVGYVFSDASGGDELFGVSMSFSNGSGSGYQITEATGAQVGTDEVAVTIDSVDSPDVGFIKMTMNADGATRNLRCAANINSNGSGKTFIFCIGENPGEAGRAYNLLLIN